MARLCMGVLWPCGLPPASNWSAMLMVQCAFASTETHNSAEYWKLPKTVSGYARLLTHFRAIEDKAILFVRTKYFSAQDSMPRQRNVSPNAQCNSPNPALAQTPAVGNCRVLSSVGEIDLPHGGAVQICGGWTTRGGLHSKLRRSGVSSANTPLAGYQSP